MTLTLFRLCQPALENLFRGELDLLAKQYSYAVAYDREPSDAISEDLANAMPEGDSLMGSHHFEYAVKYFGPNDIPIYAVIECYLATHLGRKVLAEFVVIGNERKFLSLEQISSTTPNET